MNRSGRDVTVMASVILAILFGVFVVGPSPAAEGETLTGLDVLRLFFGIIIIPIAVGCFVHSKIKVVRDASNEPGTLDP